MELINTREDLFFKSYQNFKAKHIVELSLSNIPLENDRSMVVPPTPQVMDKPKFEEISLPSNQGKYDTIPSPISYKIPRELYDSLCAS